MGLFFPSKPSTPPSTPSHYPAPHPSSGHVTKRELERDVLGRLRREGLNSQERAIVETAAAGHMDHEGFMSSGMDHKEKELLMKELREDAPKLGLEPKDLDRINNALDRSL